MSVYEKIRAARDDARLNRYLDDVTTYQTILGEIDRKINGAYPDERVLPILKTLVKQWKDGGQVGLRELDLLLDLLPQMLTKEELEFQWCAFKPNSLGEWMSYLKTNYTNLYDGRDAKEVHEKLSSQVN